MRREWQNLSIGLPESVILTELGASNEVTIPQTPLKTLRFGPEGHLTFVTWVSGPKSAIVHASWSSNQISNGDEDNLNAETKGLLTDRIADCGGDHFDHRRDCYSEPVARTYRGE